jgi:hypothetical protein
MVDIDVSRHLQAMSVDLMMMRKLLFWISPHAIDCSATIVAPLQL